MKASQQREVLFISYFFPPIKSVAVLRAYYLHQELKNYFLAVHVLTTSNKYFLQQEPLLLSVDTLQVNLTFDYRTVFNIGKKRRTHVSEQTKKGIVRWLLKVNNSFPFNLLFGEGGFLYILSGFIKSVKLVKGHEISHVYSSFMPAADHVIAYLLTIVLSKKIKWIADFRDLHVDPIYRHVIWEDFQHWVWKKMLKRAYLVTTVSEGLAKHLREYHPNVHVMRNGIGKMTTQHVSPERFDKFTIVYTGSMFKNERDPNLLLHALNQLLKEGAVSKEKIEIVYAGKDSLTWRRLTKQHQIGHLLADRGLVSHEQAIRLQRSAHLNLLLTSSHPELSGVLTGKFCEYLAAGRPILCLINGGQDPEFEAIFQETNAGIIACTKRDDLAKIKAYILVKYQEWIANGEVYCPISHDSIAAFKWENIATGMMERLGIPKKSS